MACRTHQSISDILVPWDDRRAHDARIEDLREGKVREYLRDVRSGLLDEPNERDVYRRMRLTRKVNDHEVPRNAALLFFSVDPTRWFRGAKIEVVQFAADRAGDVQEERNFGGGLADQLNDCLNYLENLSVNHLQKQPHGSQARGWVSYPMRAVRETLVNAVYHRGYDVDQPEPTKVYLFPSRIEVISYPGPVPGIKPGHLRPNAEARATPARNRRIGEYLKELKLAEGRLSGLPKVFQAMADNGSPVPRFEFDEQRTYFQATLPAHPEYTALSALRDAAHLRALGEHAEAWRRVESAWESNPVSEVLAAEMIGAYARRGDLSRAEQVLERFAGEGADRRFVRQEPADRGARGSRRARKGAPAAAHGGWAGLAPLNYSNSRRTRATTCCATSTAAAAWVRVYTSEGTPPGRPFGYRVGT